MTGGKQFWTDRGDGPGASRRRCAGTDDKVERAAGGLESVALAIDGLKHITNDMECIIRKLDLQLPSRLQKPLLN
jgi:hypothetical protein